MTAAAAALAMLGAATPAAAETVTIDRAVKRDCLARAGGAGVHVERLAARSTPSLLRYELTARAGDWDIGLFDAATGRRLSGSAGFGAEELASTFVHAGQAVRVQVCRRSGRTRSARVTTERQRLYERRVALETPSLVRVPFMRRSDIPRMEAAGLDVTHDVSATHANVVLYGDGDRAKLGQLGLPFTTLIPDLYAAERKARVQDRSFTRRLQEGGSPLPSGRTDYRAPEDYNAELKDLTERYPGHVAPLAIEQKTFEGRELGAIEIAGDVRGGDRGRPVFLLNALHHAREWPAAESAMEFAHLLAKGYGNDARITSLLDRVRVVVMPITNADGFQVSRSAPNPDPDENNLGAVYSTATGVVVFGGSLGYKRKNCNPGTDTPTGTPCELHIGVDPNRNYAESWGGPGASSNPNDQSYRGSGPFSEPETLAVKEVVSKLSPTGLITVHNVAALILRPPGLEEEGLAPDEDFMNALGEKMALATGYSNQYGWQLYDTTGTTDDWSYPATGGFGYTIEMGPGGGNFHGNYADHVVEQWTGDGDYAVGGLQEAYVTAAEHAVAEGFVARITGRAPAGRTLRLSKEFQTASYEVCAVANVAIVDDSCLAQGDVILTDERIDFTSRVPASGRYSWTINPSTRPFVGREGKTESYRLTCEQDGQVLQETELVIGRGEVKTIDMPCGGTLPVGDDATAQVLGLKRAKRGRVAIVRLRATGGAISGATVSVRKGSRTLGTKRVASLTGTRKVRVKLRGARLARGRYSVVVRADDLRVTRKLKAR